MAILSFPGLIGILAAAILLIFGPIRRVYRARKWPMPKHHALLGHLPLINDAMQALPSNCAADVAVANIAKDFPNGIFYLDFAPFDKVNVIVASAEGAAQVQKLNQLKKPDYIVDVVNTICGGRNLFTMSGHTGKLWRNTFNRGFSVAYMQSLAPLIAREVEVFRRIIDETAKTGKVVKLLDSVTKLTIDTITTIGLDARLGYQEKDSLLSSTMMSQLRWAGFTASRDLWTRLNPIRPFVLWYNKRQIQHCIGSEIEKRYIELGLQKGSGTLHSKSAISLALQEHAASMKVQGKAVDKIEPVYRAELASQIMLFLMAGQDTTSSTITFCLHQLYSHPSILDRLRAEHNEIFGTDVSPSHIISVIDKDPDYLNNLPFTLAVIKETLRLYPPASTLRQGEAGVNLVDDEGNVFPTDGCNIWVVHAAIHRDPKYFADPHSFIPDRWLVGAGDPLFPVKGAWRPFETGQRSCLGQTLAMLTIKITLLMVARSVDIDTAYDHVTKKEQLMIKEAQEGKIGIKGKNFGPAYPTYGIGLAVLPNCGYPCRIRPI